jgi:tetratricopeptide (TPR) repeat protein
MEKMFKSNTMNGTRITRIRRIGADFFNGLSATIRPIRVIRVLFLLSILLALSTVFVISNNLANGIVSGKYFWFCGSMGLMSLAVCVAVFVNKINIRFSALDGLLLLFAGSVVVVYKTYPGIFKGLRIKPAMTKRVKGITGIIAVLVLLFASAGLYYLKKDSADGRTLTWKISLQTVARHPLGVGLGNFPGAYGEMQAAYFASGQASETEQLVAGNPEYGFNEYLQIAVESGIIALLLFAGIIVLSIRNGIKAKDWGTLGSLIALLVFAGFSYPFSVLPFLIVLAFLLAANQSCHPVLDTGSPDNTWGLRIKPAMTSSIILLLVTAFCLWKQYPVYKAYKQWKNNQIYYQANLFEDTADAYGALYPYLNEQIQFLFEYAQSLSKAGFDNKQRIKNPSRCDSLLSKSNEVLRCAIQISCDPMLYNVMGKNCQAMKEYDQAETVFIKATQLVPSRLYPWYLLTKLYHEMGLQEKVNETAKIVLTKEPKVKSPAVREMREEVGKLKTEN